MIVSGQETALTDAFVQRAAGRLSLLLMLVGFAAVTTLAIPAKAAQPAELMRLRDSDRSAQRADDFDLPSAYNSSIGGEASVVQQHAALVGEALQHNAPSWPTTADEPSDVVNAPSSFRLGSRLEDSPRNQLAWGLAGTGASIFTGALLFHLESLSLQDQYDQLATGASSRRYRELRSQIDQTRKFVLTLYAVGGSMLTGGVVLMATDDIDGGGVQAKLGPAWMNGGPAARLKVSF